MRRQKMLNFFRISYNQAAVVFPYLVGEGRFFSGAIQLGGLMQCRNACGKVQEWVSWFLNASSGAGPNTGFVGWKATVDRLTGFHNAILAAQEEERTNPGAAIVSGEPGKLELHDVNLSLPGGQQLIDCTHMS